MEFPAAMTLTILASIFGDFLMKQAASPQAAAGAPPARTRLVRRLRFAGGIALLAVHFIAFLTALRLAPVSIVIPMMSCTYVGTTLLGRLVLKENVPRLRWAGIGVIVLGVALLSRSV